MTARSYQMREDDLAIIIGRIRWHCTRVLKPGLPINERLMRLRLIQRAAHDEYLRTLAEMDAKNFVVSDPEITASFGGVD